MTKRTIEDIEQAIRDLRIETTEETDRKILEAASRELEAATGAAGGARGSGDRSGTASPWARLLGGRPFRLAAAIVVALLVIGGMELMNGFGSPGVAWAEVVDRVAQADRFSFRLGVRIPGEGGEARPEAGSAAEAEVAAMTFFVSSTLGFRWDVHTEGEPAMSFIYPAGAENGIAINHGERTWSPLPPAEEAPQGPAEVPVRDPEDYIRRFLARDHEDLGTQVIDGIQAEGIQVADPPTQDGPDLNGVGRLWVSVETGLPVRIELEQRAQERVTWVLDFRWGEQVEADAFRPNVPEGFDQVPFEGWSATPGDRGDGGG